MFDATFNTDQEFGAERDMHLIRRRMAVFADTQSFAEEVRWNLIDAGPDAERAFVEWFCREFLGDEEVADA